MYDFGMLPRCRGQEGFFPLQHVVKSECNTFSKDAAGAAQSLVSLWDSGSMVNGLQEGFVVGPNASEEDERAGGPGPGLVRQAIGFGFHEVRLFLKDL